MKEGDKLYYFVKEGFSQRNLSIGKSYIAHKEFKHVFLWPSSFFYVFNDSNARDYYSDDINHEWYYGNYFYTEREIRKMKLNKLNKV